MRFSLGENKAKMTNEQQEQKMNIQYIKIKILKCILNTFILLYAKDKILSSTLVQLQHCFWTTKMHLVQNEFCIPIYSAPQIYLVILKLKNIE